MGNLSKNRPIMTKLSLLFLYTRIKIESLPKNENRSIGRDGNTSTLLSELPGWLKGQSCKQCPTLPINQHKVLNRPQGSWFYYTFYCQMFNLNSKLTKGYV